ncbi:MAG: hypothetical protein U5N86_10990 [Planctomycetota bacterium]|nr:hypothetical protein [Planctomycetota bacterium]
MSSQTGSTRTTIIALIVLAAAAGLVWFYTSSDDTGDKSATLEFWHIMNYSPVQEVIDDAVARFEADNPEVRVIQNRIKNDSFKTKLEMALGASEPPDIFHTWGGGKLKDQSDNGHVLALEDLFSDAAFSSRFAPAALDFAIRETATANARARSTRCRRSLVLQQEADGRGGPAAAHDLR